MRKTKPERRKHPRINLELPLKVAANGYDFSTSTMNVSCLGAYCRITKYVPPFTKVLVKLALPILTISGSKNYDLECRGVIVRSEDELSGGFNIAIFFNHIKDDQRKKISEYLNQFLPSKSPVLQRT